ncbi:MAG: TetR/AcrR family transcriptional regulator [Scytonematopsis contorta HA4267-MV1]|jgi:AcrR family transcriptional regulator|nr:TetR/AcrR family transcriptional regulator [Scytonematopsis contorta HA4267-MV1]
MVSNPQPPSQVPSEAASENLDSKKLDSKKLNSKKLNPKQPDVRRRNQQAHQAILKAAAELLDEIGYANTTVSEIAARAGVSNKTIYRWWPNKAAVVMEAFARQTGNIIEVPDTGSLREDLLTFVRASFIVHKTMKFGATIANLVAAIQTDSALAVAFREQFIAQRRMAVRQIFDQAIKRGELPENIDLEMAIDGVYAPIFYRLLVGHAPLDDQFAESLVEQLLSGIIS